MINPDWARWIHASINKYFSDLAVTIHVPIYIEGRERLLQPEYFELRIAGPHIREVSNDTFVIDIGINLVVNVQKGSKDTYRPHAIAGLLQANLGDIPIKKLGKELTDNQDQIFCLDVRSDIPVRWLFFGLTDGNLQGVVDARFRTEI